MALSIDYARAHQTALAGKKYVVGFGRLDTTPTSVLGANRIRDVRPLAGLKPLALLEFETSRIEDITPLGRLTRLTNADVEENCLDVSPGAGDRQITEEWIRNPTPMEEEWMTPEDCAEPELALASANEAEMLTLLRQSPVDGS